jgi:hypothetical protein
MISIPAGARILLAIRPVDFRKGAHTLAPINKVHHVHTIARVAEMLGENEDWLSDVANEMDQEDGLIWVYGPSDDGVMAFTDFGIETLTDLIMIHKTTPDLLRRSKNTKNIRRGLRRTLTPMPPPLLRKITVVGPGRSATVPWVGGVRYNHDLGRLKRRAVAIEARVSDREGRGRQHPTAERGLRVEIDVLPPGGESHDDQG